MSKPEIPGQPRVQLGPAEQIKFFVDLYRNAVKPETFKRLTVRVRELGLDFSEDELLILAALDTPARVQEFLNTQIYYNNDHLYPGQEETAMPPRRILQTGIAHCFEGAMFAYAVNFLHGHSPQMILLEANQDSDHNLVIFQDPQTKLYGANAHSRYPNLDGRPAIYPTLRPLAESYAPWYYSDRTNDPKDVTLVGYSDPFDLIAKYGVAWIDSGEPLWDIYFAYIDDTIKFHYLFDDSGETHLYQMLHAVKNKWIQVDRQGRAFVSVSDLPREAQELWHALWRIFDPKDLSTLDHTREIDKRFIELTHMTPLDLDENAKELQKFLDRGYRIEQIRRNPLSGGKRRAKHD